MHSKCRSKEQHWEWHHSPTRWNYTTQEFPPPARAKLTSLPPQALLPKRGHQPHSLQDTRFTSHHPTNCHKHQTLPKPQMTGPPDGVSGISSSRQSGKELPGATSREAKAAGNHLQHTWQVQLQTAVGAAVVKPQFPGYSGTVQPASAGIPGPILTLKLFPSQ